MPILDMPLASLKNYQGINPRPADLDAYWDASLEELAGVDPAPVFKEAAFQTANAACYDVYYTGIGGARIHAIHLRPKKITGKIPVIFLFHGYHGNAGNWSDKLAYVNEGVAVFAMDVRGQGGESEDVGGNLGDTLEGQIIRGLDDEDPKKLFFRSVFLDTKQLVNVALMQDFADPEQLYAQGGSQGGALTVACAALEPRIRRAAAFVPFLMDYKRVWEMDLDLDAYADLKAYFRFHDPRHLREDEIFTRLGYIDLQFLAPRIKADTIFITGLLDNICPPSTQFASFNKMTCRKRMFLYPDYGHENPRGALDIAFTFLTKGVLPEE